MLSTVFFGHTTLLVDRAFLLVAARVAKVADNTGTGRKRASIGHGVTSGT
jgi:hypothetical protein